jgi:hypothetical protein
VTHGELAVVLDQHGCRVRPRPNGFMAQCPAHRDGRHLSLSASLAKNGAQLLWCFNGCTFDEIRGALELPREAFYGWRAYDHKRLRSSCRSSGAPPMTLIVRATEVLNAKALLAADPQPVTIAAPPKARSSTCAVARDMGVLFGTADFLGLADFPLMYSSRWAAGRLRLSRRSVSYALTALEREGSITRGPDIHERTGRSTRTYRRAKA